MVIFLNRHHQNHSEQPVKQRKQDKICLSGAYTRCCYCVRSELFCPRCLNEQLFAANNSRPRDVACDSRAKGCYDWFCRCRAFLVLFERQKARIERLEVKYKWTIKGWWLPLNIMASENDSSLYIPPDFAAHLQSLGGYAKSLVNL